MIEAGKMPMPMPMPMPMRRHGFRRAGLSYGIGVGNWGLSPIPPACRRPRGAPDAGTASRGDRGGRRLPRPRERGGPAILPRAIQCGWPARRIPPELPGTARRVLLGREPEPARKMTGILEVRHVAAGGRHHRRRGQQANARHRHPLCARGTMPRHFGEFALHLRDALFEQADLFDEPPHRFADQRRHGRARAGQHAADRLGAGACCYRAVIRAPASRPT